MELAFHKETIKYLSETRYDQIYQEQTAEMTVPETMPEIGRIVDCFGTVTVQSKEVETGCLRVTGGIRAGVLYVPEGEQTSLQRIDVFLPFTAAKKLQTEENATLFYWGWIRSIDARFINSRKVLVRASLGSEFTLLTPETLELPSLDGSPQGLELRERSYPMRLPILALEKDLQLADEVMMPEQEIGADQLLKWTCTAEITDSRVLGEKAVFKGNLLLRVLFQNEEGQIGSWSGAVPFSQYAELGTEPKDGIAVIQPIFRQIEIDTDGQLDSHRLLLNLTMTAQILILDTIRIRLTEDAYCLHGSFLPEWQTLELTPYLDLEQSAVTTAVPLPPEAEKVLDWTVLPDRPALSDAMGRNTLDPELQVNLLYLNGDRVLCGKTLRQSAASGLTRTEQAECACYPTLSDGIQLQSRELRIPLNISCLTRKQSVYQTLSAGRIEEQPASEQPSLILRAGKGALWDLAKANGSAAEAIRAVNHLDTDYLPEETLLLIPKGQAAVSAKEAEA